MTRALIVLALLAVAAAARGQDRAQDRAHAEAMRGVYASIENNIRREYEQVMNRVSRAQSDEPAVRFEKVRQMWTLTLYNKATLFANCAAEAEQVRSPGAPRVPAENNLFLTTCVEESLRALTKFTNMYSYANIFFPDRIEFVRPSRLREREKLLPPYEFMQPAEPKLYDFPRYNVCLMNAEPISPAAR